MVRSRTYNDISSGETNITINNNNNNNIISLYSRRRLRYDDAMLLYVLRVWSRPGPIGTGPARALIYEPPFVWFGSAPAAV
jgi:hypothetical protein